MFHDIERHCFDTEWNGYYEATTREWNEIADMRLSEKDANERKTINTHLHILEPYTNLYRVWKNKELEKQLRNLIRLFIDRILNKETYHLITNQIRNMEEKLTFNQEIERFYQIVKAEIQKSRGLPDESDRLP